MAKVGVFKVDGEGMRGQAITLGQDIRFTCRPITDRQSDDAPDFIVEARGPNGMVEIGVAWRKEIQRGVDTGKSFYTFTLDDPSWAAPLYLWGFPNKSGQGPEYYDLIWKRQRQKRQAGADQGADHDDDIPF